ncbi:MAG: hypothetical protein IKW39_06140 [Alphaproteobacteria bacterium]|nr:hypothetical protein [Alphaproteobacteria bacterium]
MFRFLMVGLFFLLSACSTEYILVDEDVAGNNTGNVFDVEQEQVSMDNEFLLNQESKERLISSNDVFVVGEGSDFVIYQYRNVKVDEVSPLASMYCADIAFGGSPYLREVSMYHNGFMRATFDCVNLAI